MAKFRPWLHALLVLYMCCKQKLLNLKQLRNCFFFFCKMISFNALFLFGFVVTFLYTQSRHLFSSNVKQNLLHIEWCSKDSVARPLISMSFRPAIKSILSTKTLFTLASTVFFISIEISTTFQVLSILVHCSTFTDDLNLYNVLATSHMQLSRSKFRSQRFENWHVKKRKRIKPKPNEMLKSRIKLKIN